MRITQQSFMNQVTQQAQSRSQSILKLQQQLTTGLRIARPSDDPGVMGSLLGDKAVDARMDVDLKNISSSRTSLNQSNSQLLSAVELMRTARDYALNGAQSVEKAPIAQSIDAILEQMLDVSNSMNGGRPLFAGTASDGPAFEATKFNANGDIAAVEYRGSNQSSQTIIAPRQTVEIMYGGNEVFELDDRGKTRYYGETGAKPGRGSDTGRGDGQLIVKHTSTSYDGLGVQPGASSVDRDTILGEQGTNLLAIELTPTGQFARLNGGPKYEFDATSTDLKIFGPNDEAVYVDFSQVAPDAAGVVEITADGTLSTDGGLTEHAIDFSNHQLVTNQETGEVTNIDTSGLRRTGVEDLSYVGPVDAFQVLIDLRDLLNSADDLSAEEFRQQIDGSLIDVDRVIDHLSNVVGQQSVDLENLDWLESRTRVAQLETKIAIGDAENADLTDVILQLQSEQTLLEYVYATAAGAFEVNLLDFIR